MNIIINAISISEGGGLVVLTHLLHALSGIEPETKWYVTAEPDVLAYLPKKNNIIGVPYSWVRKSFIHHFYWYEIILPKLIYRLKVDIFFSQTNFLPKRKLSCPSLLLVQHAGYFSEIFRQLYLQCYKKFKTNFLWKRKSHWVYQSIQRATTVTVQTNALAAKISKQLAISKEKIVVIPHGAGLLRTYAQQEKKFPENTTWRLGYITKFGVQKNFSTVFKAIKLLKKLGIDIKLILTLNENSPEVIPIFNQINHLEIADCIANYGEIADPAKLTQLYESLHLFVFPSLCESFGFTLIEAMASGLPLIVANTESNIEITGKAGNIFSSESEDQLAEEICRLIYNKEAYISASQESIRQSQEFCWNKAAQNILNLMHQLKREYHEKK